MISSMMNNVNRRRKEEDCDARSTFRHPPGLYFSLEFDRKRADYSVTKKGDPCYSRWRIPTYACSVFLCFLPQGKRPMLPLPSPSALSVRAITRRSGVVYLSLLAQSPQAIMSKTGGQHAQLYARIMGIRQVGANFTCKLQKVAMMRFSKHMQLVT